MLGATLEDRYDVAKVIYDANRREIDAIMAVVGENFGTSFVASSEKLRELAKGDLLDVYDGFHWHDVTTFPFLEGTTAEEHGDIQVFRISPVDNSINPNPHKLAGLAAGAFGGFLKRDWRQHDILWGRLDGAERIVTALLPAGKREEFVTQLQEAILADEFGGPEAPGRRLALVEARLKDRDIGGKEERDLKRDLERKLKLESELKRDLRHAVGVQDSDPMNLERFRAYYATTTPLGPRGQEIAGWGSRSASILARMIDGLTDRGFLGFAKGRAAGGLRAGGVLSAQLARFAMPGTFARSLAEHLLLLSILAGALLVILGTFNKGLGLGPGLTIIAVAVVVWVSLYLTGRAFRRQDSRLRFGLICLGLLALFLAIVGLDDFLGHPLGLVAHAQGGWSSTVLHLKLIATAALTLGAIGVGISLLTQRPRVARGAGLALIAAGIGLAGYAAGSSSSPAGSPPEVAAMNE